MIPESLAQNPNWLVRQPLKNGPFKDERQRGLPSDSIGSFSDLVKAGVINKETHLVLYIRVSTDQQWRRRNHIAQLRELRKAAKEHCNGFVDTVACQESGDILKDRQGLQKAVAYAKEAGGHMVILAVSRDRLIRSSMYYQNMSNWPDEVNEQVRNGTLKRHDMDSAIETPSNLELLQLRMQTNGIQMATLRDPDASADSKEVASIRIKEGQRLKNRKGGRPLSNPIMARKKTREEQMAMVKELHSKGYTYSMIFEKSGVKPPTAHSWVHSDFRSRKVRGPRKSKSSE